MARTNAQKRAAELAATRRRQERRREGMRQRGQPDTATVDRALIEAMSFLVVAEGLAGVGVRDARIHVHRLIALSMQILVERLGYDRAESARSLRMRFRCRPEHRDPSHIPSFAPDRQRQLARREAVHSAAA